MEVIDTIWISSITGQLGIVLLKDRGGKNCARMCAVNGFDQEADIKRIVDFGGKISLETAQILLNHLKED